MKNLLFPLILHKKSEQLHLNSIQQAAKAVFAILCIGSPNADHSEYIKMLFLSREYVDNSSGSDSAAEESPPLSTAPPPQARDEGEFEYQRPAPRIQPRSNLPVRESMPVVRSNPWIDDQPARDHSPRRAGFITDFAAPAHVPEAKKPKDEKVGIFIPEPPKERPALQRPGTGSARPGTGNAAMRARMLEQQKNHLMGRKESMQVTANIVDPRARLRSDQPLEMLEKMLEKPSGKTFQGFASHIGAYEPVVARREEKLPAPVASVRTVFKEEEIEEVRLDESTAVRNTASKALQHLRRKSQDEQSTASSQPSVIPYKPAVQLPQPVNIPAPPVKKPVNPVPAVPLSVQFKDDSDEEVPRSEAASRFSLEEVQHTLPQARILGHGREPPRKDPPVPMQNPPLTAATDDRIDRRPMTAQHTRAGSMPPTLQEPERPVEPIRPKVNLRVLLASEMQDMKRFLTTPVHQDVMIQCSIRREKGGLKNRFYPKYFMHLSDGYTFLLAGKKRANNKTSNYLMSMNQKEMTTKSPAYLGKVRSNFLGTEFIIYNTGLNPSKKSATRDNSREELGVVLYQSNILGTKGPRKMRVLIPVVNSSGEQLQWKPMAVTST